MESFFNPHILLASASPRRQMLLKESGFKLDIIKIEVEENFDSNLKAQKIPLFLAEKKNKAYSNALNENQILVTADTIVWCNNEVLNKPLDIHEAREMLKKLSNTTHTVYTAVSMRKGNEIVSFYDESKVYFNHLDDDMINYYLTHYAPLDKAGAYGIQEFIGYVGIQKIDGCYYNVMGFPVSKFINELKKHNWL
jgi:septum formation protein